MSRPADEMVFELLGHYKSVKITFEIEIAHGKQAHEYLRVHCAPYKFDHIWIGLVLEGAADITLILHISVFEDYKHQEEFCNVFLLFNYK